ncbi:MAG: glycosyltransferase, partial [Phycisphaerales bacterium]|nr:glycosyltransferase [Phycisphaerales bacterium]
LRRWLLPRYPKAVEELSRKLAARHELQPIDLLISTSSAAIKALVPPKGTPHICYCHAPARYLWSQTDQYTTQPGLKSKLRAAGLDHFGDRLRQWDKQTADTVTQFIANSHFIANQIRSTYDRDAVVIHPPVRTDYFTPPNDDSIRNNRLLYIGAIEPYKRVDLAIEAALLLGQPLDIAGDGSHLALLKKTYKNNPQITFHGHANDPQVRTFFRTNHALLQPQIEDFGITAVESQACGLPVIARRAGGALDSIIESKTGTLFDHPNPKELAAAIEKLPTTPDTPSNCRTNALRFSYEAFTTKLDAVIAASLSQ